MPVMIQSDRIGKTVRRYTHEEIKSKQRRTVYGMSRLCTGMFRGILQSVRPGQVLHPGRREER